MKKVEEQEVKIKEEKVRRERGRKGRDSRRQRIQVIESKAS